MFKKNENKDILQNINKKLKNNSNICIILKSDAHRAVVGKFDSNLLVYNVVKSPLPLPLKLVSGSRF